MDAKPINIYLIRHAETIDNRHKLISGGDSNPPILPEGLHKAKKSRDIYRSLLVNGYIAETTPVITSGKKRAQETATAMTGRTNFTVTEELNERNFGKWASVLTERLYKEFRAAKDLGQENTKELDIGETIEEHKNRVAPALGRIIEQAKTSGSLVVFSHSGTMRRISEILTGNGDIKVEGTVPYRAQSLDGGKTWEIKKLSLENGKITENHLEPKEKSSEAPKIKLADILNKHKDNILITNYGRQKILKIAKLKSENIKPLAEDLGKLLIGEHYNTPPCVRIDGNSVSIALSSIHYEIFKNFAQSQGIHTNFANEMDLPVRARLQR